MASIKEALAALQEVVQRDALELCAEGHFDGYSTAEVGNLVFALGQLKDEAEPVWGQLRLGVN